MDEEQFRDIFLKATKSPSAWIWANGQCYIYALVFHKLIGGTLVSYLTKDKTEGHAFVEKNGKYFDSEYPSGIENWRKLKKYLTKARKNRLILHENIDSFKQTWIYPEDEELVESIVKKIKELNEI